MKHTEKVAQQLHRFTFRQAISVWEVGTALEKNRTLSFVTTVRKADADAVLALAGSTSYIVLVNGELIAHGPARCAHGFYRVDELPLGQYLQKEENIVAIRIAGYNVNSFATLDQPSFLCAELTAGGKVLAYTGVPAVGFAAFGCGDRLTRVQRFSFQRPFVESYRLYGDAFAVEQGGKGVPVALEAVEDRIFLCRDLPYGDYRRIAPSALMRTGSVAYSDKPGYYNSREITQISDRLKGYREEELEFASYREVGKMDFSAPTDAAPGADTETICLCADSYADLDMGKNHTGIFELEIQAEREGALYLLFDEVLIGGVLNCFRMGTSNIVAFLLQGGTYRVRCCEPYVMRYLRLVAVGTKVTVRHLRLCEVAFPESGIRARFLPQDAQMKRIYDAAVETFRANTVDIYMDCPSRERAGWLCDSFFTSRVERVLTGESVVERAFLENFLLPDHFACLPDGMLPMCYPSDHYDGVFIPNWAMWYGVELEEYLTRTGDRTLIDAAKDRMYALLAYFRPFENEYGLLEGLKSWVFVEWSKSNELVQDVSFASNMLYAGFKKAIGTLYGDSALCSEAEALRHTIDRMAMTPDGFYCDNALRRDGQLVLSGGCTESCQYYAFFFDIATPDKNPRLWQILTEDFGYDRQKTGKYPQIYPANAFIGNYLRLDLLRRYGLHDALADNIRGYFLYMAERTGTLWENVGDYASCNHGFASHVLYWMDVLGYIAHD